MKATACANVCSKCSVFGAADRRQFSTTRTRLWLLPPAPLITAGSLGFGQRIQSGNPVSIYLGIGTAKSSTSSQHCA
jgi:hypothetical protein